MTNLSEKETREKVIDPYLYDAGWKEEFIKREVNSVRSDFKSKKYQPQKDEMDRDGRFIDYLLLDSDKSVLAIIEAKKFSVDAEKGSIQATTYQKDIEAQINEVVPIFLTNGQVYFGKLKSRGSWIVLTDIYYLQLKEQLQSNTAATAPTAAGQENIQLVKLGSELHGPEDAMYIKPDKVLFWENLKPDSKAVTAIKKYQESKK